MSEDIVKRLRAVVPYQGKSAVAFLCHEAADEIEKLSSALRSIVEFIDCEPDTQRPDVFWMRVDAARKALSRGEHLEAPSHD